jgi:hypothetical protein
MCLLASDTYNIEVYIQAKEWASLFVGGQQQHIR